MNGKARRTCGGTGPLLRRGARFLGELTLALVTFAALLATAPEAGERESEKASLHELRSRIVSMSHGQGEASLLPR
jgi:hypothetical protein